jgi:2-haloacid dehalogenase
MSGMAKFAKYSGLPWDVILAAELAQTFKPAPKVYQLAPRYRAQTARNPDGRLSQI